MSKVSPTTLLITKISWFESLNRRPSHLQQDLESKLIWEALSIMTLQGINSCYLDLKRMMAVAVNVWEFSNVQLILINHENNRQL